MSYVVTFIKFRSLFKKRVAVTKTKKSRKTKIGVDVPQDTSKWDTNFQLKRSKVKVTGHKNHRKLASCLLTGGRTRACGSDVDCKLGPYAIVRPNLLSAP